MMRARALVALLLVLALTGCTSTRAPSLFEPGEYEKAYDALVAEARPAHVLLAAVTPARLELVDELGSAWTYEAGQVEGPHSYASSEQLQWLTPVDPAVLRRPLAPALRAAFGATPTPARATADQRSVQVYQMRTNGELRMRVESADHRIEYTVDGHRITVESFYTPDGWATMCDEIAQLPGAPVSLGVTTAGWQGSMVEGTRRREYSRGIATLPRLVSEGSVQPGENVAPFQAGLCRSVVIRDVLAAATSAGSAIPVAVLLEGSSKEVVVAGAEGDVYRCDPAGRSCLPMHR